MLWIYKGVAVVGLAACATLTTWALVRLLGVQPITSNGPVGAIEVVLSVTSAGLIAWGVWLWLLNRGAVKWWPLVASTALAVSIVGPAWMADGVSAVALICLHVVAGFVLTMGFVCVLPDPQTMRAAESRN